MSLPELFSSGPIGTTEVPDESDWRELCRLADDSLPPGHALRTLYAFGVALGEYELALPRRATLLPLVKREPPCHEVADLLGLPKEYDEPTPRTDGPLPDLVPLLHATSNLPIEVVERVALLGPLAQLIKGREHWDPGLIQAMFLQEVCGAHPKPLTEEELEDVGYAISLIRDSTIEGLEKISFEHVSLDYSKKTVGPWLNINTSRLYVDGTLEAEFADNAKTSLPWLVEWQKRGWPECLPDFRVGKYPISPRSIDDVRKFLNKKCKRIEFSVYGGRKGLKWRRRPST